MQITNNTVFKSFQSNYKHKIDLDKKILPTKEREHKAEKLRKAAVLGASAIGIIAGLALVGKHQKLNPFTKKGYFALDYTAPAMSTIAGCSLVGGVATGIKLDPENKKSKLREGLQQFVGNIIFPTFMVGGGSKVLGKFVDNINLPKLKGASKLATSVNFALKKLPHVLLTTSLLGCGLFLGNKVANFINNKIFEEQNNRKLRISDLSGHLDDACLATTLVAKGTNIGDKIGRLIPPALVVPGFIAGTKTAHDNHHH